MQQLDIFADSRDVMLRDDVLEQLQRRDAVPARLALERLVSDYPVDGSLPAMRVLVRELEDGSTAPFVDHAALANARQHLEDDVVPAARRVLPAQAVQPWLAPCWRALAARAASLAFRATEADGHTGITPRRCSCWRATAWPRSMRLRASNRGGASRHRSHG
ncbi:hypothetical protein ACFQ3P_41235 [Paraburkholderia sabiae]|uniref:Uncharacterized protein n=1 Tax=Paraburkholderia sabiae TaxID=273251 RepID=A0ABU9QRG1_9BURK|nr:hypothetical protein [Paraburkholderia sabiae]WJZ79355.1 hypothetical protein QEN71_41745 [Paraburkholderia sabiae]CAD6563027.1 hypothetical protein LMG24235_08269 [Paraburkholderia sabiae]